MADLKVLNLYNKLSDKDVASFRDRVDSSLRVISDYDKVVCNYEWLDLMEDTIRYLDNILRNPNKFIVNEEDVIKIELAKRVTVESIKHLSRNTNLIQDYNKKTGDVKPSKILNITKEESYDTYENRLIYTLIQNMKYYINRKKSKLGIQSSLKDSKKLEYKAKGCVGKEKIDMNMTLHTDMSDDNAKENENDIAKRIETLEIQISGLCNSDVYKSIDKLHITLVTPPIKKTNVIIKNVNFQYAMKLWNYLQEHVDDDVCRDKKNKDYMDNGVLKDYMDETFLLNYLTAKSLDGEEVVDREELSEKLVSNMIEKIMDVNKDIDLEELQKLVSSQYTIVKYRNVVSDKKIQEIFKGKIDKYLDRVDNLRIRGMIK